VRELALNGKSDMALLALDAAHAPMVRPYLTKTLDIYASSQIHSSADSTLIGHDLDRVHFLDMPWLLQPDHPAVMAYARPQYGGDLELERMYALGIDAYRIGLELLQQTRDPVLDGVTGRILLLESNHQFVRELTPAEFVDGKIQLRTQVP
jgi:outer membrane PBP1 activator LpoA protein